MYTSNRLAARLTDTNLLETMDNGRKTPFAGSAPPTPNLGDTAERQLTCLWLTRVDPRLADAGDLSYSFHLLTSLGRAGVSVTVLSAARAGSCAQRPVADGVEWRLFIPQGGRAGRGS